MKPSREGLVGIYPLAQPPYAPTRRVTLTAG